MKKQVHTGSANRREMSIHERTVLDKHVRRIQRGIARREKRDRLARAYAERGDHPSGAPAQRRRRQIAEGRLTAANGLISTGGN